jgi:hypothetical protein
MSDTMLPALGRMGNCGRFFVYLLTWNAERQKFDKKPNGSPAAANMSYRQALTEALRRRDSGQLATVGMWIRRDSGLFFLDIDKLPAEHTPDDQARALVAMFPGAFVEWSTGKRGLHIVGTMTVPLSHSSRNDPLHLEFYTADRGIALNIDGAPMGNMNSMHDVAALVKQYFPLRIAAVNGGEHRPQWRGPADDDVLLQRMLAARRSADSAFGGKVSFAELWAGKCEHESGNDMALANHLAFWTGCDEPRIERMMLRSGMRRDKWSERRPGGSWLQVTIANACAGCENVYQEPLPLPLPPLIDTNVRSGAALMKRSFAPIQWALRDLIPQGTSIFSAAPKAGKSWLVLQACIAVAAGVPLWPGRVSEAQGDTLYLDLEGNDRRLQERIAGLLKSFPPGISLDNFYYETEWPRAEQGAAKLREWLAQHPNARMVIIDTLASWRDADPGRKSTYMADYSVGEMLKPLTREFSIAIVTVSHTRKMGAADAMDKISGTQGLVGSMDNYLILTRAAGNMDAELVVNGRDIREPQELALRTLKDGGWICVGNSVDVKRSDERGDVLAALAGMGGVGTSRDIHAALENPVTHQTLYKRLQRMSKAGELMKSGKFFTLLSVKDHDPKLPGLPAA